MIVGIKAFQDKGKTALAVGTALELCANHGYDYNEIIANISLKFPVPDDKKPHSMNNAQMRQFINKMVVNGLQHKIILLDEADRVFPARFWQRAEQTEALIGLWQDYKLFNYLLWTGHAGTGVDLVLRQVTQIELEPDYQIESDTIPFIIYNEVDGIVSNDCLLNVSRNVFPYYDRWERVV